MITIYLYDKASGLFIKERSGNTDSVMLSYEHDGLEFTLIKPPDYRNNYKWNGSEWVKEESD